MVSVVAVLQLGRLSSARRVEDRVVKADVGGFAVDAELNGESAGAFVDVHTVDPCLVSAVPLLVATVLHVAHVAQVAYAVVARFAVDVVDSLLREFAVMVKPRQPVSLPDPAKYADPNVSASFVGGAHDVASLPARKFCSELISSGVVAAREDPGFRVIMNVIFELFLGDHADTSVKAVEGLRQPLTRWWFGSYPSRVTSLTT